MLLGETRPVTALLRNAEAPLAAEDLRRRGYEVTAEPARAGRYALEDETFHDEITGARHGGAVGFAVGIAVGLLVALLVPTIADLGVGAQVLLTLGFGVAGILPGIVTGLALHDTGDDDPARFAMVTDTGTTVIVANGPSEVRAHRILRDHDAAFVTPTPTGPA